jgi:hypothetical protein
VVSLSLPLEPTTCVISRWFLKLCFPKRVNVCGRYAAATPAMRAAAVQSLLDKVGLCELNECSGPIAGKHPVSTHEPIKVKNWFQAFAFTYATTRTATTRTPQSAPLVSTHLLPASWRGAGAR